LKQKDKGNYYDRTVFWKEQIQAEIKYFITKENYNCVIVTAGPFKLAHHVAELKGKYPEVKFIVDFRDLWTEDVEISSFAGLSPDRKKYEKVLERETVTYADKVIAVAPALGNYFASLSPVSKTEIIPNGFDPDDFKDLGVVPDEHPGKIKFVFTGTLYLNLDYILKPFFEGLARLKEKQFHVYEKMRIEFIGHFPEQYRKYVSAHNLDVVHIMGGVSLREIYRKIKQANYCFLFLNDIYNFALSTKFCEYISQKRKIVVVSAKGPASEFIQNNKIGFWIDPAQSYNDLLNLMESSVNGSALKWDTDFDINSFSLDHLTDKLIPVIEYE
jgi:glycosyltransferase involved in cell wall biosynthesis